MTWTDGYWESSDGLRLHYRDYAGPADRPPILCFPGLTRNARDFETVAARLSPDSRVIAVEFRGRGGSANAKDPLTYTPLQYAQDVELLLTKLAIDRFVAIGTSLGGIVTMLLGAARPGRLAGVLLNDVGPVIETAGLDRIKSYVGRGGAFPTWLHAARYIADVNAHVYPDYTLSDWLVFAKRLCRLTSEGRIVFAYDKKIAEPFKLPGGEAGVDLWPLFDTLADVPALLMRGELSDVVAPATTTEMVKRLKSVEAVTVPRVGHAPVLDEPEAAAAIDRLLARIA